MKQARKTTTGVKFENDIYPGVRKVENQNGKIVNRSYEDVENFLYEIFHSENLL